MTSTHLSRLSREVTTVATVLTLGVSAACSERRPPPPVLPPLGPGPIVTVRVPGAVALEPAIATRPPFAAIAFATRDSRGPLVYLSTSADNGATFSEPQPITRERTDTQYKHLRLSFKAVDPAAADPQPVLELEWQSTDGTLASHTTAPWKRSDAAPASERQKPLIATALPRTSCSSSGEAVLVDAEESLSVAINHSLTDEACVPGEVVAVADSRKWIHAAWIGRTAESMNPRVLYASALHGNGFGFSQVLADNRPKPSHLRVVTDPNETIVTAWDQDGDGQKEVWLRQLIPSHFGPATLLPLTRLSGKEGGQAPALASIQGGVIAAWVLPDSGALAIRRVGLDALCAEPPAEHVEPGSSAPLNSSENTAPVVGATPANERRD